VYQCFPGERVRFYDLTSNLQINWDSLFRQLGKNISAVYLHYFNGVLPDKTMLQQLQRARDEQGFFIIEDTTHSIFSAPLTIGDCGVCSLRKWFPIPDGGVLYSKDLKCLTLENLTCGQSPWVNRKAHAMKLKHSYLLGQVGEESNVEYRNLFAQCEHSLDQQDKSYRISTLSQEILKTCSVSQLIHARRKNFMRLKELLTMGTFRIEPIVKISGNECPLTFPIRVKDRDAVREYLISQKIYCAIHWPLYGAPRETSVSNQELSLPIDQRYGETEMQYLADSLYRYRR